MIKFKAEDGAGRPIVGLGLSEENVKRLKDGQPILVKLSDLGMGDTVITIFYGKTEVEMEAEVRKHFKVDGGSTH